MAKKEKRTSEINKYGYYVHYLASSFIKQQKLPQANELSNYAIQRTRSMSGVLKSGISADIKRRYANTLSSLYGRNISNNNETNLKEKDLTELHNIVGDILDTQVKGLDDAKAKILWESGRIVSGEKTSSSIKSTGGKTKKGQRYLSVANISQLNKLINEITIEVQNVVRQNAATKQKFEELENLIKQVQNLIDSIDTKQTNSVEWKTLAAWSPRMANLTKQKNDNVLRFDIGKENQDLLSRLNEEIKRCKMKDAILRTAQGTLTEDLIAIAGEMIGGIVTNELSKNIEDVIKKNVIGGKQEKIKYLTKGLPESVVSKTFLNDVKYNYGSTIVSKYSSQQKIDVVVNLPEDNKMSSFKKVNISAKSINLQSKDFDIGIVKGTNLFYLVQDENRSRFLRPVFNIIADHTDYFKSPDANLNISKAVESAAVAQVSSLRTDAIEAIKIISAFKALSGMTYSREAAQLFVVNDTNGKKVYVLEINDIIKAITNKMKRDKSSINQYFSFDIDDLVLENTWEDSIAERQAKVIMDARKKKINVALRNIVITNNLVKEAIIA